MNANQKLKLLRNTTSKLIWQGWSNDREGTLKMEEALLQNIEDIYGKVKDD